jgi:NAD(P)-dependent dehydrogenase (short-subunit alcohol dehydrogenase family)
MRFSFVGKTAVVTGGGSGIGQAVVKRLAEFGARVVVLDISGAAAQESVDLVKAAGGEARAVRCDVGDASSVEAAFASLSEAETVDILVNSAGIAHIGTLETTDEAAFDRLYRVNVKGVYLCCKAGVARMAGRGGVIVNMASIASLIGLEDRFAYSMTKGAVLTMTRSIAVDYMQQGIRCNCVCPARVHTPFVDRFLAENYAGREAEMFERLSKYQPLGRMASADEVAMLTLYLCSEQASFITGQALPLDGGVLVK